MAAPKGVSSGRPPSRARPSQCMEPFSDSGDSVMKGLETAEEAEEEEEENEEEEEA